MKFIPGLIAPRVGDRQLLAAPIATQEYVLPSYVDLRAQLLTASNQGNSPMCAAYAMAGVIEWLYWKRHGITQQIDPAPIYERSGEILGEQDGGRTLESVMQAAMDLGLITAKEYENARSLKTPNEARQALHRYGVVLSAFEITDKWFYAGGDGWILPGGSVQGGHAVVHCAYDHRKDNPKPYDAIQGSWSAQQAAAGYSRLSPELFDEQWIGGIVIV